MDTEIILAHDVNYLLNTVYEAFGYDFRYMVNNTECSDSWLPYITYSFEAIKTICDKINALYCMLLIRWRDRKHEHDIKRVLDNYVIELKPFSNDFESLATRTIGNTKYYYQFKHVSSMEIVKVSFILNIIKFHAFSMSTNLYVNNLGNTIGEEKFVNQFNKIAITSPELLDDTTILVCLAFSDNGDETTCKIINPIDGIKYVGIMGDLSSLVKIY